MANSGTYHLHVLIGELLIVQNGLSRLPLNDQLLAKAVVCQAVPGSVVSSEGTAQADGDSSSPFVSVQRSTLRVPLREPVESPVQACFPTSNCLVRTRMRSWCGGWGGETRPGYPIRWRLLATDRLSTPRRDEYQQSLQTPIQSAAELEGRDSNAEPHTSTAELVQQ